MDTSYPDLIGWALEKIGPELPKKDRLALRDRFFDDVKRLEWLLHQARAAKRQSTKDASVDKVAEVG